MKRTLMVFLLAVSVIGCARGQVSSLPNGADPGSAAHLYIIRKSEFVGGGISIGVSLDHHTFVSMRTGDFVHVKVTPGRHVVTVATPKQGLTGHRYTSDLELHLAPQSTTYVLFESRIPSYSIYEIGSYLGGKYVSEYKAIPIAQ